MAKSEYRFSQIVSHCDNRQSTRINAKKGTDKFIITEVPSDVMLEMEESEVPGVKILPRDSKIILFGGSTSNIVIPTGVIHGKHTVKVVRKKCGAVLVERYNSAAILSSPRRRSRECVRQGVTA